MAPEAFNIRDIGPQCKEEPFKRKLNPNGGSSSCACFHVVPNIPSSNRAALDFAGAYLDNPPDLSEEVWTEWEIQKAEQFDARWRVVRSVLAAFEELDIHILDVTPKNITFLD